MGHIQGPFIIVSIGLAYFLVDIMIDLWCALVLWLDKLNAPQEDSPL